jgi:DUF2075 family protein
MIVYQATKQGFAQDVLDDKIEGEILKFFKKNLNQGVSQKEVNSWKNSMQYMDRVLNDPAIPGDCGVAIEYRLPQSAKRIDFIITGMGEDKTEYAVLVELKQWSQAKLSPKDGIVHTFVGNREGEHTHPSYQAWSYASLLANFNETIETDKIGLLPCAYLHNYADDDVIKHEHYRDYIEKAPIFLQGEAVKLRNFIKRYVRLGDRKKLLYRIDQGKIRPSKMLADSLTSMLKGNEEFIMIDEQKIVFENAKAMANRASIGKKKVMIVRGGPGTGKSVVAINLIVALTKLGMNTRYVSKNAAPRAVYEKKLTGSFKKTVITNLFTGSGAFIEKEPDLFDSLIVDEAHRLNNFSGLYKNLGESQIKEIISSSKASIFFIDEDQRVTLDDVGTSDEIKKWAKRADAEIVELELYSQFRCNGSNGYLAWLDQVLQIRETANTSLEGLDYDFRVFSSPMQLRKAIVERNSNNKARMVAGYCWPWKSKKNPEAYDVFVSAFGDFKMRWNLETDGSLWIINPDSINEIGCIHTCQGLEVDYIGVIVGLDFIVRNGKVVTQPSARAISDNSIKGYKKLLSTSPVDAGMRLDMIIKNTYRTLMTRGMKGCYVYFVDPETQDYFATRLNNQKKA